MAKITTLIIGVLLTSIFVTFFMSYLNNSVNEYGVTLDNDTMTDLAKFDESDTVLDNVEAVSSSLDNITTNPSIFDKLEGLFQAGYSSLLVAKNSFTTVGHITDAGLENLPLENDFSNVLRAVIIGIITVLIIIGVILSVLVRQQL